jgi:hypothetical protein
MREDRRHSPGGVPLSLAIPTALEGASGVDPVRDDVDRRFRYGSLAAIPASEAGTALLAAVCSAAKEAGATDPALNATPEGKRLYRECGFAQIGEGVTWWWAQQRSDAMTARPRRDPTPTNRRSNI